MIVESNCEWTALCVCERSSYLYAICVVVCKWLCEPLSCSYVRHVAFIDCPSVDWNETQFYRCWFQGKYTYFVSQLIFFCSIDWSSAIQSDFFQNCWLSFLWIQHEHILEKQMERYWIVMNHNENFYDIWPEDVHYPMIFEVSAREDMQYVRPDVLRCVLVMRLVRWPAGPDYHLIWGVTVWRLTCSHLTPGSGIIVITPIRSRELTEITEDAPLKSGTLITDTGQNVLNM